MNKKRTGIREHIRAVGTVLNNCVQTSIAILVDSKESADFWEAIVDHSVIYNKEAEGLVNLEENRGVKKQIDELITRDVFKTLLSI